MSCFLFAQGVLFVAIRRTSVVFSWGDIRGEEWAIVLAYGEKDRLFQSLNVCEKVRFGEQEQMYF